MQNRKQSQNYSKNDDNPLLLYLGIALMKKNGIYTEYLSCDNNEKQGWRSSILPSDFDSAGYDPNEQTSILARGRAFLLFLKAA